MNSVNGSPLVSVIIPTFNSEKTLRQCLQSINNQTYRNIEILVVDNFSKDKTLDLARAYSAKVLLTDSERAAARNLGFSRSMGKYMLSLDSDMELTNDVTRQCVELAEAEPKIGGIIIPERSIGSSFWVRVRDFERSFYEGTAIESARFFRKTAVETVGGYDEKVVFYEESTLPQKIGRKGYCINARIDAEIMHHEEDFSLWHWLKKKYYYAKTAADYRNKYADYGQKQMSLYYRLKLFVKSPKLHTNKVLTISVIVLKLLEFSFSGLGLAVAALCK